MKNEYRMGCLLLALVCAGCSGSSEADDQGEDEDPEEHACELAADMSAGTLVTASAEAGSAPVLELSEEPYLVEFEQGSRGYVTVTGPGDSLLFVGQADAVTALRFGGSGSNLLPEAASVEHCAELIPEHFDLELEESGEYTIELTSAAPPLWLMHLSAEGHGHE